MKKGEDDASGGADALGAAANRGMRAADKEGADKSALDEQIARFEIPDRGVHVRVRALRMSVLGWLAVMK